MMLHTLLQSWQHTTAKNVVLRVQHNNLGGTCFSPGKPAAIAGSAWTRGASSVLHRDLDCTRELCRKQKMQTTKETCYIMVFRTS